MLAGKRGQQFVEEVTSCPITGRRLLITDEATKVSYLVDTGSDLCCFPRAQLRNRRPATSYTLSAANNSSIKTYGLLTVHLRFAGLRRTFTWRFVVADVATPIIGADFLANYGLLPDLQHNRLIDSLTGLYTSGLSSNNAQPSVRLLSNTANTSPDYADILAEFPQLARPDGTPREVHHNTVHYIKTTPGPPVSCGYRRLAPDRLQIAQREFNTMLREGTARRSSSPWASPSTWCRKRRRAHGAPAGTTDTSMPGRSLTDTRQSTSTTALTAFVDAQSSPSSIW